MTSNSSRRGRDPVQAALTVAAHLTDRDRYLVRMVGRHRVLTTDHLCDLAFTNPTTARHRLSTLVNLELLNRFRPRREKGSAPWHYVMGPVGAALLEVEDHEISGRWRAQIRRDRLLALQKSQRLGHMIGVNGFFTHLIRNQRNG